MRTADLRVVQRASVLIGELGAEFDARLIHESRPRERLWMLREFTNRITRTANDAINAYQRASRTLSVELARPNADVAAAHAMRAQLHAARGELLMVLDNARHRYPPRERAVEDADEAGLRRQTG